MAAILVATSFGDVVIHNHPSGHLTPSQPDMEIAGIVGNQGVGFYIVDNQATRCYQAVAPLHGTNRAFPFPRSKGGMLPMAPWRPISRNTSIAASRPGWRLPWLKRSMKTVWR